MTQRHRLWAAAAGLLLLWAALEALGLRSLISLQRLHDGFEQHALLGALVYTGLFMLGNLMHLPGWLFLSAAVLALGPAWGAGLTYVAATLSCISTFWVVRALGADSLRALKGRLARRLFAQLDAQPVRSVALLRLVFQTVPALNYALALSGVRFRAYLLGTLIGLPLPIVVFSVFLRTLATWLNWPLPPRL